MLGIVTGCRAGLRGCSPAPPSVLEMSLKTFVLRSLEWSGTSFPPCPLPLYRHRGRILSLKGRHPSLPAWHLPAVEEPVELAVCPPNPVPPSPAPAWLGRWEGSDFTACQLRPKNTRNSEMLGQGEERAGTRDGVCGGAAMVTWPEKPLRHHSPAQESWARSPGSPSGPTSSNDRGGSYLGS